MAILSRWFGECRVAAGDPTAFGVADDVNPTEVQCVEHVVQRAHQVVGGIECLLAPRTEVSGQGRRQLDRVPWSWRGVTGYEGVVTMFATPGWRGVLAGRCQPSSSMVSRLVSQSRWWSAVQRSSVVSRL